MKKILVLGNSHVGALKLAYDKCTYPYQLDFYSIPGGKGPELTVRNSAIVNIPPTAQTNVPITDNMLKLTNYDALLLAGVGARAIRNVTDHPLHKNKVIKFKPNGCSGYSERLMRAVIEEFVKQMPSIKNIKNIESNFSGNIYIQMFPLPTRLILEQEDFSQYYSDEETLSMLSWYYGIQLGVLCDVTRPYSNINVLQYENDWMLKGCSPDEFGTKDAWHMNYSFGNYVLNKLAEELN